MNRSGMVWLVLIECWGVKEDISNETVTMTCRGNPCTSALPSMVIDTVPCTATGTLPAKLPCTAPIQGASWFYKKIDKGIN